MEESFGFARSWPKRKLGQVFQRNMAKSSRAVLAGSVAVCGDLHAAVGCRI